MLCASISNRFNPLRALRSAKVAGSHENLVRMGKKKKEKKDKKERKEKKKKEREKRKEERGLRKKRPEG